MGHTFMLPQKLAFVDIETTGARPTYDRILEIGIVRVENNTVVATYNTLFNPHTYISPFIENLTGISQIDVEDAPTFWEAKEKIMELLDDCVFVAHNVRFDYGFLRNELKRHEMSYSSKHFCTVRLSQILYPQYTRHDLDHIIERFNIPCENRHRAFDDAYVLWEFYQRIQQEVPEEKLIHALNFAQKRPSRPLAISEEIIDDLPESPGVYLFYSEEETPLYIGKSINIRDRVLSHFANDALSGTDMHLSQEVKRIEYMLTGGELSALFKESTMVKQLQPLYNRKLRLSRRLTVIKKVTDENGYDTVAIESLSELSIDDISSIIAVTRSKKQAKTILLDLAKEHSLCHQLLNLEKSSAGCFAYRLGWCKGACKNKELPVAYNIRFTQAFTATRIQPWPFDGPILIEEENIHDEVKEIFVVDKWCVLGCFKNDEEIQEYVKSDYIFDMDTYKILKSFLKAPKNYLKIKELKATKIALQLPQFHLSNLPSLNAESPVA